MLWPRKDDRGLEERMWAIYLEHAEKVGPRARAWRADADGVLTFVRRSRH